ncbi:hypothetical protein SELMODRAFT_404720 [Selaginella moellendorffii]|uniref:Uncharacterized protein n=1 Tax=Selaginella moellendorffii TaxID=88036 RepID=D8QW69_SELML|nr:hypothetical protein SELMODRAFT_404720 [Selaginella moellendorffii]
MVPAVDLYSYGRLRSGGSHLEDPTAVNMRDSQLRRASFDCRFFLFCVGAQPSAGDSGNLNALIGWEQARDGRLLQLDALGFCPLLPLKWDVKGLFCGRVILTRGLLRKLSPVTDMSEQGAVHLGKQRDLWSPEEDQKLSRTMDLADFYIGNHWRRGCHKSSSGLPL